MARPQVNCTACSRELTTPERLRSGKPLCDTCRRETPELHREMTISDWAVDQERRRELLRTFPMSTLPPSQPYDEFGIVAGTAVMGANIVLDVFAGITDVVGGRSGKYQAVLETGRETALAEMCEEAQ